MCLVTPQGLQSPLASDAYQGRVTAMLSFIRLASRQRRYLRDRENKRSCASFQVARLFPVPMAPRVTIAWTREYSTAARNQSARMNLFSDKRSAAVAETLDR